MSKGKVARIAKAINDGDIDLSDIELESNEQYEECWCLVDTGAGMSSASHRKHFPGATFVPLGKGEEPISLCTANGEVLVSKGSFNVTGYSQEGQVFRTKFVDADMDMPILAGSELCEGGAMGRELRIHQKGGVIRDLKTSAESRVVKRRGVYFIKLKMPKKYVEVPSTGFGRQESP